MRPLLDALRLPVVLHRYRELLSAFVSRELRSRIAGSILGRVWPVVQPAMLFGIYYFIFVKILRIPFSDALAPHGPEGAGWRSTFYLITGILPWTVLSESLSRGTGVVLEHANLIKKIAFPSELLPIYQVFVYHVYFLVGFGVLLVMEAVVNGGLPGALVMFPVVLVVQFVLITGLTMILSAANVFVRDVMQAVPIVLTFWMFTTPVFYDPIAIQGSEALSGDALNWANVAYTAMAYNPMAILIGIYRAIFSYGTVDFPWAALGKLTVFASVALWLGYAWFLRCKGRFADEV
ncbi:MAG: ABC transporter permease [Planctomycetota bacterium]